MNEKKYNTPTQEKGEAKLRQGKTPGEQEKENYAEHLARVIPDADHSKALLQAHYKALQSPQPSINDVRGRTISDPEE